MSYFVSIGQILSQLVIFCLIWPYFVYLNLILPILCVIYGTFLVGTLLSESIKLVKIVDTPTQSDTPKAIPGCRSFITKLLPDI